MDEHKHFFITQRKIFENKTEINAHFTMKMMMVLWRNECNKLTARWRGMVLLSRDGFIDTWFVMTFFTGMLFSYFLKEGLRDYFNCSLLIFETIVSCQIAVFIWNYWVDFDIWIDIFATPSKMCLEQSGKWNNRDVTARRLMPYDIT